MPAFEDFIHTQPGDDIFQKTRDLADVLASGVATGVESLGIESLGAPAASLPLRKKDGTPHASAVRPDVLLRASREQESGFQRREIAPRTRVKRK